MKMKRIPIPATSLNGVIIKRFFVDRVISFVGQDYCWPTAENKYSGKGFADALYQNTHDCSGTVTDALHQVTGVDLRGTHNAQKLHDECEPVETPEEGDLAFYGKSKDQISHVMVCLADGRVVGASGGNSKTTTPDIAKASGAKVKYQTNPSYRKDLIGFGRLFSK